MSRFFVDRKIYKNQIWAHPVAFRLFFYILGQAQFKEKKVGNILVKRGQYLRSYRNLREDLTFIENGKEKQYGLATLHRAVEMLIELDALTVSETVLGTLFTLPKYQEYQAFPAVPNIDIGTLPDTASGTPTGTAPEQQRNNKNKGIIKANNKASDDAKKFHPDSAAVVNYLSDELKKAGAKQGDFGSSWFFAGKTVATEMLAGASADEVKAGITWLVKNETPYRKIRSMSDVRKYARDYRNQENGKPPKEMAMSDFPVSRWL